MDTTFEDLRLMDYSAAWDRQKHAHELAVHGSAGTIFFVEHPPVVTLGRREGAIEHLVASKDALAEMGVQLIQSDRGGDITFHGPGQLVVYPVIPLGRYGLNLSSYVHGLEGVVIGVLAELGIAAHEDPSAIGVWVGEGLRAKKVCAVGVRVAKGVSLHGIALNLATDLEYFSLIVPCGLSQRGVTTLNKLLGDKAPTMDALKALMRRHLERWLSELRPA